MPKNPTEPPPLFKRFGERKYCMGIRNKNISNITLQRTIFKNNPVNLIKKFEYVESETIEEAEEFISKQMDNIPVEYDGLSIVNANLLNKFLIDEFNYCSLKNISLNGIHTFNKRKDSNIKIVQIGAVMAVRGDNRQFIDDYNKKSFDLMINSDTIESNFGDDWTPERIEKTINNYRNKLVEMEEDWDEEMEYWSSRFESFIPGALTQKRKNYLSNVEQIKSGISQLDAFKKRGITCWGAADYADDPETALQMMMMHEIGHLRHFDLFPGTSGGPKEIPDKKLANFMTDCRSITAYAEQTQLLEENFAEYYSLYRCLPNKLKELSPIGYKKFQKIFK